MHEKSFGNLQGYISVYEFLSKFLVQHYMACRFIKNLSVFFDVNEDFCCFIQMGYASLDQSAGGIHTRLFSRAFIFESDDDAPVVFVSVDIGMLDQGIKTEVTDSLLPKCIKIHA